MITYGGLGCWPKRRKFAPFAGRGLAIDASRFIREFFGARRSPERTSLTCSFPVIHKNRQELARHFGQEEAVGRRILRKTADVTWPMPRERNRENESL
jgi:hypothetical protein